jgi:DNA-directed RNA polymerase subunit RPC12/RpoP
MSGQVQCPHCGGFKVTIESSDRIDKKTGLRYGSGELDIFDFSKSEVFFLAVLLFPLWLAIVIVIVPFHILHERSVPKDVIWEYSYVCNLCGYKWIWQDNEPLPQIQIQPELISKGEQLLEEERQRREKEYREAGMWMKK